MRGARCRGCALLLSLLFASCSEEEARPRDRAAWQPPLEDVEPGTAALRTELSGDGREAVVWYDDPGTGARFRFYRLEPTRAGASCRPVKDVVIRPYAATLRWVSDGAVLLSWGAGTSVAEAVVFDRRCRVRLSVGAPAMEVSPDGRYLMTFPGLGTPLAEHFVVEVFDLATGQRRQRREVPKGSFVTSIHWRGDAVRYSLKGADGEREEALVLRPSAAPP